MPATVTRQHDRRRWLRCENLTEEEAPAYSIVRVTGVTQATDGLVVYEFENPRGRGTYAVLGESPIPAGGFGRLTFDWPARARLGSGVTDPVNGENFGVEDATWDLKPEDANMDGLFGFFCFGLTLSPTAGASAISDTPRRTLVSADQPMSWQVLPDNDIDSEKSGRCTITEADINDNSRILVWNDWMESGQKVTKDKEATAKWFPEADAGKGRWQFDGAECE